MKSTLVSIWFCQVNPQLFIFFLFSSYTEYLYESRFGANVSIMTVFKIPAGLDLKMPGCFSPKMVACVFENLNLLLKKGKLNKPFCFLPQITPTIEIVLKVCAAFLCNDFSKQQCLVCKIDCLSNNLSNYL